jgi:pilus assembly protein Flp/PilA
MQRYKDLHGRHFRGCNHARLGALDLIRIRTMKALLFRFVRNDSGVTAIEYGLIAGLIAVVIIGAVTLVGQDLLAMFNTVAAALAPAS